MGYQSAALIDGAIFDDIIEFKSIMERADISLRNIQFIHKDKLSELAASGGFAPPPLVVVMYGRLTAESYAAALEEAKRLKQVYEINNCILVFTAPAHQLLSKDVRNIETISVERFELVSSVHVINEDYLPQEYTIVKLLAVLSAFNLHIPNDEIAFGMNYVTASVEINYNNYIASIMLAINEITDNVIELNKNIAGANDEIEKLRNKKKKKYACRFSEFSPVPVHIDDKLPARTEQLAETCRRASMTAEKDYEAFLDQTESDVSTAQHSLSATFRNLSNNNEIDPDKLRETEFAEGEAAPESVDLIERRGVSCFGDVNAGQLYALLRTVRDNPGAGKRDVWKPVLFSLLSVALGGIAAYVIRLLYSANSTAAKEYGFAIALLLGAVAVALATVAVIELIQRLRLRRYLRKFLSQHAQIYSDVGAKIKDIRAYIDKYVTVAVNSFIKTKQIDLFNERIRQLKKQKQEYSERAASITKQQSVFFQECDEDFTDTSKYASCDDILKYIRKTSDTVNLSNVTSPDITHNPWIRSIAFEYII